ncbi:MoaD/ThiS family protein [Natronobiforma cellulositropha]|uniref:MoaD/ThiS family protein n=1 Tax=Natronobiforma cellulositropha TaxID=1679076 RepID=UPI0021D5B0AE|nr:MoaD/ThiS family protein [Natronobiforma cellulositropha]
MHVEVLTYGHVREAAGEKRLVESVSEGATVATVLGSLTPTLGIELVEAFERDALVVHLDGRDVKLADGLETELESGARLSLTGTPMPE